MHWHFRRATCVGLMILGAICTQTGARAESGESFVRQGNTLYYEATRGKEIDEDKLKDAIEAYKEALRRDPTPLVKYNLGTAQARLKAYQDARQTLSEAAEAPDGVVKQNSNFNLGIVTAKPVIDQLDSKSRMTPQQMEKNLKTLEDTLKSFRSVIVEAPNDNEAVYNYEVTKNAYNKLKKMIKNQPRQNSANEQNQNSKGSQSSQQNQQNQQGQQGQQQNQQGQQGQQQNQQGQQGQQQNQQGQQGQQQNQQGQQGQQQNQQGQQGQQQNQQGQQGQQQNQQERDSNKSGRDAEGHTSGKQKTPEDNSQTQATRGGDDSRAEGQRAGGGLEEQRRQKASGASGRKEETDSKIQQAMGGESGSAAQSLTPEQMNAMGVLNLLEKERPDQYKRLFQFRNESRKLQKDW